MDGIGELGSRISVRGASGSGKTTLAAALAEHLDLPHVELDALYWKPNWTDSNNDEFADKVGEAAAHEKWVMCGNYSRIQPIVLDRATAVIYLDLRFWPTFRQLIKRTWRRGLKREMLWGHSQESLLRNIFDTRHSVVWWMIKTHRVHRERCEALLKNPPEGVQIVRIASPAEAREFLRQIADHAQPHELPVR